MEVGEKNMMILFFPLVFLYFYLKFQETHFQVAKNTIICFTGTLGSGKTLFSITQMAKKKFFLADLEWHVNFFTHKLLGLEFTRERPCIYSNIPLNHPRYVKLRREHLLLQDRIIEFSIVVCDEIGQFAGQYDYKNPNVQGPLQEFIRFFRHYVDGTLICTDQSSDNIVVPIRRRISVINNLNNFTTLGIVKLLTLGLVTVGYTEVTPITSSEDIKTIEMTDVGMRNKFKLWIVLFKWQKMYESRCYKKRYKDVPINHELDIPGRASSLYLTDFIDLEPTQEELKAFKRKAKYT